MAQKQIKQLTEYTAPTTSDLFVVQKASDDETVKVTGANLTPDGSITAPKLSTSAITLGYTEITSNYSTAATSATQITGLTVSPTIPAGGRRVKVTAFLPFLRNGNTFTGITAALWLGTVGSGTKLQQIEVGQSGANEGCPVSIMWVGTPSAGSVTYNVSCHATAGTTAIGDSATSPAFILVEAI